VLGMRVKFHSHLILTHSPVELLEFTSNSLQCVVFKQQTAAPAGV
jgi:hypothetical protein